MRKLQQFCAAVVLTLALALSALGGEMGFPGVTNSPPPPQQSSITGEISCPGVASTGDMQAPGIASTGGIEMPGVAAFNPATETMLSLLQSVLSFF